METTRIIPKNTAAGLYAKSRETQQLNPLFEDSHRSMSCGDYINLHQRQYNVGGGRFSWLMPDED